jgi:hypothetical protein
MAHTNENGPVKGEDRVWRWERSVGGGRVIAAEREFWTCGEIDHADILTMDEWQIDGDVWTRKYLRVTSNKYGDMMGGQVRVFFKPDTAEVAGVDGN